MQSLSRGYSQKKGPSLNVQFFIEEKGIKEIKLADSGRTQGIEWELIGSQKSSFLVELIDQWIESYVKKKQPEVNLPVILEGLPPYTTRVLSILKDIPFGISLTYKELAEITGNPLGARAVGNACARNPCPLVIPCHRVLAADEKLGGFSAGIEIKKILLAFEKIQTNS